jgi:DNA-binding NtrC family response regulator/tetratricopeptide (TPR) repeat protein
MNVALRHAHVAERILATSPNIWLQAVIENIKTAACIIRSDYASGIPCGMLAYELAEASGVAVTLSACLGNLGNLFHALGQFDRAAEYFERALVALPFSGERTNGNLDNIARVRLAQNRVADCAQLLGKIDNSIRSEQDRVLYAHRHSQLTRALLLAQQDQISEAIEQCERTLSLAARAGDQLLKTAAILTKAELLQLSGAPSESNRLLNQAIGDGLREPEMYAQYERICACGLAASGNMRFARPHYERARRIYQSLQYAPGSIEFHRHWSNALSHQTSAGLIQMNDGLDLRSSSSVFHSVASIIQHADRPELVACEIVDLLAQTECAHSATAVARAFDGSIESLAHIGEAREGTAAAKDERCLAIGSARDREIEVWVRIKQDIESTATLNAVILLLATLHDLECARAEREERATLWPIDELPTGNNGAIASGHMREMMTFARKIANTNVMVLITGESGTGKEIVARAIHTYSARAQKPFIPFNCTAVPRELLESQLFGHRRGAFTGADRDNPGVIRSARDGTLFLDEIGELSLDLQPKLLRFLESGEICPLGESTPFTVNVRIVAATNSSLETLVRQGRFREDLFYRLNVIRLPIKPLRERRDEIPILVGHFVMRAVEEFQKGHVRIAEETIERLVLYDWPGNVRQLQNEVRRMVALAEPNSVQGPSALSTEILGATAATSRPLINGREIAVPLNDKLTPTLSRIEREMIKVALRDHEGKVDAAAKALGISRKGLYLKRQRLGL